MVRGILKRRWEKILHERMNVFGPKHQLSKSDFVNQLCSVWNEGMSKENVIVGFQSTGKFKENLTFLILCLL